MPPATENNGPLFGHVRKGRKYQSPLSATAVLQIGNWVRDDLPDLLWPVIVVSELGTTGIRNMVAWQKAVQQDLAGKAKPAFIAECLDGRFTSLDRLAAAVPEAVDSCRTRASELHLLQPYIDSALRSYPFRPAMWLSDGEAKAPDQDDLDLILDALINVLANGHHESLIKCLPIWSAVQAGTLSTSKKTIELLEPYPNDPATRDAADSAIRAMWGARRGLEISEQPDFYEPSIRWAKVFWGANSMTSRCLRKRDIDTDDTKDDTKEESVELDPPTPVNNSEPTEMPADGAHLRGLAMDLVSSYVEALETAPAHLYHHEMQEVHAGLVARAGRDVITVLAVPDMWCAEHGSHVTRALVEARIYLRWMAKQDVRIYEAFQNYGSGKAKLYAKILGEIPEDARRDGFADIVDELRKLSHNDDVLDYRDVDTSDSFSGKSIRLMAQEAGLLDFYRQLYYMASGVAHSEWWSIETHAMERCRNPMHGGHLIPSLSLNNGGNVELAGAWVDLLCTIMRESLQLLGTDRHAVDAAFAWMKAEDPTDGS